MAPWVKAGCAYFGGVFAAGFMLGTFRVLFLEDRIGAVTAVILETPVMLAFAWFLAGYVSRRFDVPAYAGARIAMGTLAVTLLVTAETILATVGFGVPIAEHFWGYISTRGSVTAFGQAVFAAIPFLRTIAARKS